MNRKNTIRFQTGNVILLSFCHFVHDIYLSFLAPLLPFITERYSLSLTQAGFLTTVMQIPAFANPQIGKMADRINIRHLIVLAPALSAVSMSLLGVAPDYLTLLIFLFFAGVSTSLFHVPAPVMIHSFSGEQSGKGMSFYMTGGETARAVGPIVIIAFVSQVGFDHYYPIMTAGVAITLWLYFCFKNVTIEMGQKHSNSLMETLRNMRTIFIPLTAILFFRGFMHASLTAFLPLYMQQMAESIWIAGISLSVFETAGIAGILVVGSLSDLFGRKKMLFFSLVVAPLSLLGFVFSSGIVRFVLLIVTGFSLLSTTPVMLSMIQESSKGSPSAANGIFMMINFLARSSVVVVVGFIADVVGLEKTYLISAVTGMIGIPFIFMIRHPKQQGAAGPEAYRSAEPAVLPLKQAGDTDNSL